MTAYNDLVNSMASRHGKDLSKLEENLSYYDSTYRVKAIGISTPEEMRALLAHVGWPRMYLDSIASRLEVLGFRMAGTSKADKRLLDWWEANNMSVQASMGMLEALLHGRAFITAAAPGEDDIDHDPNTPKFRVESPKSLFVDFDLVTGRAKRGLRLYTESDQAQASRATLLLPNETVHLVRSGAMGPWVLDGDPLEHNIGQVLIAPLVNRPRLGAPLGESEITPELRSITDAAARLLMNMQATAELMAIPQRLLFGVAQEALATDPTSPGSVLEAYMARIIAIEDHEAHAMQFAAAELRNFVEGLQELAKQARSYTGLPGGYFGLTTENPASAEAIRMEQDRLVMNCESKQTVFESGFEQMNRLGMLAIGEKVPRTAFRMETLWRDPSTPTFASRADAVVKLATAKTPDGRPVVPTERARIDLGYTPEEREEMDMWDRQSASSRLAALYAPTFQEPGADPSSTPEPGEAA